MPLGCEILPNGAPDSSFAQPSQVEVVEGVGVSTTFALLYPIAISDGDYALLGEDRIGPEAELAIRVVDGDATSILVRGPVTGQRISLVTGGDGSTLEVIGGDATIALAREARVKVWPDTTDADAITQILTSAGIAPVSVTLPSSVTQVEAQNALVQREPDLHLVRRLARRNGCWFWLEHDPTTTLAGARVERPPVDGEPIVSFHLEGADRNVEEATIEWDVERVVSTDAGNRDSFAATDMDGSVEKSPLSPLADKALADIVSSPRRARLTVPVDDAGDLIVRSEAALIEQGWFASVSLAVRAKRLKQVVRAHSLVALHGAGARHSGNYLVARVVHRIDADDHLMSVTLVRNGWN